MRRRCLPVSFMVFVLVLLSFQPVSALQPDEVLDDPVLEARARELSAELRCMVCQNQSIDDSDAELARDLRVLVRDRLTAGDTDEEVIEYVVDRYGEFVLLKPRFNYRNALLWGAPFILLSFGGALIFANARHRNTGGGVAGLNAAEQEQLDRILNDRE